MYMLNCYAAYTGSHMHGHIFYNTLAFPKQLQWLYSPLTNPPPPSPNYNHGCIFHCTFQPPPQTITQSVHSTPFIHSFSDIEPWLYMPSHLPTPWFDLLLNYKLYRLKELLRTKLIECGWHDQLKDYCKGRCLMFYCILLGDLKRKNLTGQQIQNLFLSRD